MAAAPIPASPQLKPLPETVVLCCGAAEGDGTGLRLAAAGALVDGGAGDALLERRRQSGGAAERADDGGECDDAPQSVLFLMSVPFGGIVRMRSFAGTLGQSGKRRLIAVANGQIGR